MNNSEKQTETNKCIASKIPVKELFSLFKYKSIAVTEKYRGINS